MKIKKGDKVIVIAGKDRGKTSRVLQALPLEEKIVVENVNLAKKHKKPRRGGEKGQIVEMAKPIHVSNVKLICPKCGQAARVGYKRTADKSWRMCKKCNQEI